MIWEARFKKRYTYLFDASVGDHVNPLPSSLGTPRAGWPMPPPPTLWPGSRRVCQEGPCEWPSGRVCTPGRRRWKRLWTAGKGDWSALASPSKRIWANKGYDQNGRNVERTTESVIKRIKKKEKLSQIKRDSGCEIGKRLTQTHFLHTG